LSEQIDASLPKQLGNIAAFLAPVMVAPVGTVLEALAGAG
jgi:hypothetical protein